MAITLPAQRRAVSPEAARQVQELLRRYAVARVAARLGFSRYALLAAGAGRDLRADIADSLESALSAAQVAAESGEAKP
ncbi:MAG: hypothetical protein IPI67_18065 [Myxococcales bacterium]|nr:hypothetical protein [Myxococcales bacterium]